MNIYNNLDDVREYFNYLFANKDAEKPLIQDFLRSLYMTESYRNLLESALGQRMLLDEISRASYNHANGFDKITLLDSKEPKYTIRMHIWWPGQYINIGNIHNHVCGFSSIILSGSLSFWHYEENASGEIVVQQYECLTHREKNYYEIKHLGQSNLHCSFEGELVAGTTYSISTKVLHRIVNTSGQIAATLMVYGSVPSKSSSKIFSENPVNIEKQSKVEIFSVTSLEEKLRRLLDKTSQSA